MDKLGILYTNQTSMCLELRVRLAPGDLFQPSSKIF